MFTEISLVIKYYYGVFLYTDIDECISTRTNDCSQFCNNTFGSFQCSCWSGYELDSDGRTCNGIKLKVFCHYYYNFCIFLLSQMTHCQQEK